MKVLVTDGICPSTPAIIESLSKLGHQIFCSEETKWNASFFSRYLTKGIVCPSSENAPEKYREKLLQIIKQYNIDFIIPVSDASVQTILENREAFADYVNFLLPLYEDWLTGADKIRTMKLAYQHNVSIPKTLFAENLDYKYLVKELGSPFITKLSVSSGSRGVFLVKSENDHVNLCNKFMAEKKGFLMQEFIPPGGRSLNLSYIYDNNHQLIAWFASEQLRTYPFQGGTTSLGVSIQSEELLQTGKTLLDNMNWVGVAGIDVLQDPRDGIFKILEVNPRYWTSLLLAIKSGVDYPHIMMDIIEGKQVKKILDYKTGLHYSFIPYELIHLIKKGRLSAFRSLFPSDRHCDVFLNPQDPGLFGGLIFQLIYIMLKKRRRYIQRSLH